MRFSDILILGVILGGGYTYLFSKDKPHTVNEELITQFDKHGVIKQHSWQKGNIIDGVQLYSARKDYSEFQSLWNLGKDEASVTVLTEGKELKVEAAFALNQCNQLAKVVTDNENSAISDAVFSIFKNAIAADRDKEGVLRAIGDVGGKSYDISARPIGSVLAFSCGIKTE